MNYIKELKELVAKHYKLKPEIVREVSLLTLFMLFAIRQDYKSFKSLEMHL